MGIGIDDDGAKADLLDQEAITYGRGLMKEVKAGEWHQEEKDDLAIAVGFIGCPIQRWDVEKVAGKEIREETARLLIQDLRGRWLVSIVMAVKWKLKQCRC